MKRFIFITLSLLILSSCGTTKLLQSSVLDLQKRVNALEIQAYESKQKIESLEKQTSIYNDRIDKMQRQIDGLDRPAITSESANASSSVQEYKTEDKPKAEAAVRTRCQATTKSGTQCKRMAAAGSKYCWQHQK